jgi:hypothetical protein
MRLQAALLAAWTGLAGCSGAPEPGLGLGEERVAANEPAIQAELIRLTQQITLERRADERQTMVYRFNQSKSVACLDAELVVGALPPELAVGLFATPRVYPAKLRFANATQFDDRKRDLRGLSVKVSNVPDAVSVGGANGVQDFTFNNYPALFAATPDDFLSFVEATANGRAWAFFLNPFDSHLKSALILLRARSAPDSPFAERYYSTTPSRLGAPGTAAKYSVQSCAPRAPTIVADDPDYLRRSIAANLETGPVCLALKVQTQTDPGRMPIEDASVTWPEDLSPYRTVAEIRVPPQMFESAAQLSACEAMRFNPWNGLSAHQPLGGINRVRRDLYEKLAELRASENSSER